MPLPVNCQHHVNSNQCTNVPQKTVFGVFQHKTCGGLCPDFWLILTDADKAAHWERFNPPAEVLRPSTTSPQATPDVLTAAKVETTIPIKIQRKVRRK